MGSKTDVKLVQPARDEVRTQLDRILGSRSFLGSKRCQQFLEYVCTRTLDGRQDLLKERLIAVEVFGRPLQSDLGDDTIVRVGAREVRKRLAQYYSSQEALSDPIRIDLQPGTYVPEFRYTAPAAPMPAPEPVPETLAPPPPPPPAPAALRIHPLWLAVPFLSALLLAALFLRPSPVTSGFDLFEKFWAPVFQASQPLLLSVGHPLVYHPSLRVQRLNEDRLPPLPYPQQRPIQIPPREINGDDLVPVRNQYVGFGDLVAATEIASLLGHRAKDLRIRMSSNVAFADLRKTQTLLIGAITNRWTMELGQNWRFRFHRTVGLSNVILDTASPPGAPPRQWSVPSRADGQALEDYVLISRVPNSSTGGLLIVAAGIKQFGTEAAGHLLTDPAGLSRILSTLPAGWEQRNIQIVLRVKVIGDTPAQPEPVASHVW